MRAFMMVALAVQSLAISAALADDPKVPVGAQQLTEPEIKSLLDGRTFSFTAYDEPLTGTNSWDARSGSVSGSYVWKQTEKGTYDIKWFIKNGKNCTQSPEKEAVCQVIYRYGDGFMEVNAKGAVHAVSVPIPE